MRIVNEFEQIPFNVAPKLKKSDVVLTTYKNHCHHLLLFFFFNFTKKNLCGVISKSSMINFFNR